MTVLTCEHDERESKVEHRVNEVIERIRPLVVADGGDISVVDIDADAGVVTVHLSGACVTCPSSANAMRVGIERILMDQVPEISAVIEGGDDPQYVDTKVVL